jgi:hypothetical protein
MSLRRHARTVWRQASKARGELADGRLVRASPLLVAALVVALAACLLSTPVGLAQSADHPVGPAPRVPALHTRTAADPDGTPPAPVVATGHGNLPQSAEGEYPWNKAGDTLELYFEHGRLHGYMSESADPDNQHAAPLTFDFATTHADGSAVEWTTRVIHNTWYSFTGHLERGLVQSPMVPGYYLLTGTLTEHGGDADGYQRTVSLKREPGQP